MIRYLGRNHGASPRRGAWLAGAATVALLLALMVGFPDRQDPDGAADGTPAERRATELPRGWAALDPGPLAPRSGASLTWTGSEVIVLAGERHADGAAYHPSQRRWREIARSPLPPGVPQTVWTGDSLIAISNGEGRVAAAYDPVGDRWRPLPPAPASKFAALGGFGRPAFYWAGDEAILVDAWAAYRPSTDRWRQLPAPTVGLGAIGHTQAVAVTGRDLWLVGIAGATHQLNLDTGTWKVFPAPKTATQNSFADAVVVGDELYFASEAGVVSRLVGRDWRTVHLGPEGGGCVPEALSVRGQPVVRLCEAIVSRSSSGDWRVILPQMACCYRTLVSSGNELFLWDSNDDVRNDPSAPRKAFRVWSPG